MADSDGELAARVEAKATKLVEQRDAEVDAARGRRKNDEAEYTRAKDWPFDDAFHVISAAFFYMITALTAGFALDLVGCMAIALATGDMNNEGSLTMTTLLPLIVFVVMVLVFIKTISEKGKVKQLKKTVSNDEEGIQLAQRRLASARELRDRVNTLAGRMRTAVDDADREATASQLERLERELDSELASRSQP